MHMRRRIIRVFPSSTLYVFLTFGPVGFSIRLLAGLELIDEQLLDEALLRAQVAAELVGERVEHRAKGDRLAVAPAAAEVARAQEELGRDRGTIEGRPSSVVGRASGSRAARRSGEIGRDRLVMCFEMARCSLDLLGISPASLRLEPAGLRR